MARFWSDRPLGVKLAALVAAGGVSLGVFAVITVQALDGTGETADQLLASAEVSEAVILADMMHDAVRADVLQALVSGGEGEQYGEAVAGLREHSQFFRELLAGVVGEDLDPEITRAVEEVTPAVEAYLGSAEDIVARAGVDPGGARAAYPRFGEAFSFLEEELPKVDDAASAHALAAADRSSEQRATAITLSLLVAGVGVLVLAVLGWAVTRSVVGPVRRVGAVVAALAEGDLCGRAA